MVEDIYDPLDEYINVFRDKFKKVSEETFEELAREAAIDVEANRETCRKVYDNEAVLAEVKNRITWWTVLCVVLWLLVIGGALVILELANRASFNSWCRVSTLACLFVDEGTPEVV